MNESQEMKEIDSKRVKLLTDMKNSDSCITKLKKRPQEHLNEFTNRNSR